MKPQRMLEVEAFFYGCTGCECVDHHTKWAGPSDCPCCQAAHRRALAAGQPSHWIKTPQQLWAAQPEEGE